MIVIAEGRNSYVSNYSRSNRSWYGGAEKVTGNLLGNMLIVGLFILELLHYTREIRKTRNKVLKKKVSLPPPCFDNETKSPGCIKVEGTSNLTVSFNS